MVHIWKRDSPSTQETEHVASIVNGSIQIDREPDFFDFCPPPPLFFFFFLKRIAIYPDGTAHKRTCVHKPHPPPSIQKESLNTNE